MSVYVDVMWTLVPNFDWAGWVLSQSSVPSVSLFNPKCRTNPQFKDIGYIYHIITYLLVGMTGSKASQLSGTDLIIFKNSDLLNVVF